MNRSETSAAQGESRRDAEAIDEGALAALVTLLKTCEDGEQGYREAAADVGDRGCQLMFAHYADERAAFAQTLAEFAESFGAPTAPGWVDLRRLSSWLAGAQSRARTRQPEVHLDRMPARRGRGARDVPGGAARELAARCPGGRSRAIRGREEGPRRDLDPR